MQNIAQFPFTIKNSFGQLQSKKSRRRKYQTLSAIITTSKLQQGFMVTVSLNYRGTTIASDLLHIKDCPSPERAFLAGYNRSQVLAEDFPYNTRLYIANQHHKGGIQ